MKIVKQVKEKKETKENLKGLLTSSGSWWGSTWTHDPLTTAIGIPAAHTSPVTGKKKKQQKTTTTRKWTAVQQEWPPYFSSEGLAFTGLQSDRGRARLGRHGQGKHHGWFWGIRTRNSPFLHSKSFGSSLTHEYVCPGHFKPLWFSSMLCHSYITLSLQWKKWLLIITTIWYYYHY